MQKRVMPRRAGSGRVAARSCHARLLWAGACRHEQFNARIRGKLAILPLFANRDYITEKASSSILMSLMTGTPLLFTREEVRAYSFLDASCAYVRVSICPGGTPQPCLACMSCMLCTGGTGRAWLQLQGRGYTRQAMPPASSHCAKLLHHVHHCAWQGKGHWPCSAGSMWSGSQHGVGAV